MSGRFKRICNYHGLQAVDSDWINFSGALAPWIELWAKALVLHVPLTTA